MTERVIKPRAWVTSEPDGNPHDGSCGRLFKGVELCIDRPDFGIEPLYDQSAIDAAVAKEREECAKVAAWILKMPENDVSAAIRARGQE